MLLRSSLSASQRRVSKRNHLIYWMEDMTQMTIRTINRMRNPTSCAENSVTQISLVDELHQALSELPFLIQNIANYMRIAQSFYSPQIQLLSLVNVKHLWESSMPNCQLHLETRMILQSNIHLCALFDLKFLVCLFFVVTRVNLAIPLELSMIILRMRSRPSWHHLTTCFSCLCSYFPKISLFKH